MTGRTLLFAVAMLAVSDACRGDLAMDVKREALDLGGKWETLVDHQTAEACDPAVAAKLGPWKIVDLPGLLIPDVAQKDQEDIKCVWAQREFALDRVRASRGVALRWNGIRFGFAIWINGQKVAERDVAAPSYCLLPAGLVKEGTNRIVVRATGWGGVARGRSGFPLAPFGASNTQSWGGKGAGFSDIWLEFYDGVYVKSALAMPDLQARKVTLRLLFDASGALPGEVEVKAEVALAAAPGANPSVAKRGVNLDKANSVDLDVPIDNPRVWTPETPTLYVAKVSVSKDGKPCDIAEFRFGMREAAVADGRYRLNGQPLWLRGSNLVGEWNWGGPQAAEPKRYLVDEARLMNLNSFRTHAGPPNTEWSDIADEHGILFLAELPVLMNTFNLNFTAAEWEVWHANVLATAEGWITKLWNHPAIYQWVLSNESGCDNAWEAGDYYRFVKALDPTRPAMRASGGGGTPDTVDIHTCSNTRQGADGWAVDRVVREAAKRDPKRTLGNSEYMNDGARKHSLRWLGEANRGEDAEVVYAQLCSEHTEAMRRLKFDLVLPYMYAGWTSFGRGGRAWRDPYPTPMAAALHSCMAPVLASLDVFDADYVVGAEVASTLVLINERKEDVEASIDLYVLPSNPFWLPDPDAVKAAVSRQTLKRTLKANTQTTETVRWRVPANQGTYFLAAVLTRNGDRPVVSQREVRAVTDPSPVKRLKGARLVVLGAEAAGLQWLKAAGADAAESFDQAAPPAAVVVWSIAKVNAGQRAAAPAILEYVRAGGRVVVLDQLNWDWPELAGLKVTTFFTSELGGTSRVFQAQGMGRHPLLAGVFPEMLHRWNGLPGAVAECYIEAPGDAEARVILWAEDPRRAVALSLPIGKGEILACQVKAKDRLYGKSYDPAAEQVMLNLLAPVPR